MAIFSNLEMDFFYGISAPETGGWLTRSIRGSEAMAVEWPKGALAWGPYDKNFCGGPHDIAKDAKDELTPEIIAQREALIRIAARRYQRTRLAAEFGAAAFAAGMPCVPAADQRLIESLGPVGSNEAILKAWLKGWTEANLA